MYLFVGRREKHIVITCVQCKAVRRFPTKPGYELWCDSQEAKNSANDNQSQLESSSGGSNVTSNCVTKTIDSNSHIHEQGESSLLPLGNDDILETDVKVAMNEICLKVEKHCSQPPSCR